MGFIRVVLKKPEVDISYWFLYSDVFGGFVGDVCLP